MRDAAIALAITFDGTNDYASTTGAAALQTASKSISFWAKPSGAVQSAVTILGNDSANWQVGFGPGNTLQAVHTASDGAVRSTASSSGAVLPDQWAQYTITWSVSDSDVTVAFYVNGSLLSQTSYSDGYGTVTSADFYLGAQDSGSGFYHGTLAQLQVWDRALTAEEVARASRPNWAAHYQTALVNWLLGMKPAYVGNVTAAAQADAEVAVQRAIGAAVRTNTRAQFSGQYTVALNAREAARGIGKVAAEQTHSQSVSTAQNSREADRAAANRLYEIAMAEAEKQYAIDGAAAEKQYQIDLVDKRETASDDQKARRADAEKGRTVRVADAVLTWQTGPTGGIAATKVYSIAVAAADRTRANSLAGLERTYAIAVAGDEAAMDNGYGGAAATYWDWSVDATADRREDVAQAEVAYWSAEAAQAAAAVSSLHSVFALPWTQFLVEAVGARQVWRSATATAYLDWVADQNAEQATYQATVSGQHLLKVAELASAAVERAGAIALETEARDRDCAAAEEAYVGALSGTLATEGPAETFQRSLAQAQRDYAVAVATARRAYQVDDDGQAYQAAVDQAMADREERQASARRTYAAAEAGAVAARTIALAEEDFELRSDAATAFLGEATRRTAAERVFQQAECDARETSEVNWAGLAKAYWLLESSEFAEAMSDVAVINGSPWAIEAARQAAARTARESGALSAWETFRTSAIHAQNDYEVEVAAADEARNNARVAAAFASEGAVRSAQLTQVTAQANAAAAVAATAGLPSIASGPATPRDLNGEYAIVPAPLSDYQTPATYQYSAYSYAPVYWPVGYWDWGWGYYGYLGYGYPYYGDGWYAYGFSYYGYGAWYGGVSSGSGWAAEPEKLDLDGLYWSINRIGANFWDLSGQADSVTADGTPKAARLHEPRFDEWAIVEPPSGAEWSSGTAALSMPSLLDGSALGSGSLAYTLLALGARSNTAAVASNAPGSSGIAARSLASAPASGNSDPGSPASMVFGSLFAIAGAAAGAIDTALTLCAEAGRNWSEQEVREILDQMDPTEHRVLSHYFFWHAHGKIKPETASGWHGEKWWFFSYYLHPDAAASAHVGGDSANRSLWIEVPNHWTSAQVAEYLYGQLVQGDLTSALKDHLYATPDQSKADELYAMLADSEYVAWMAQAASLADMYMRTLTSLNPGSNGVLVLQDLKDHNYLSAAIGAVFMLPLGTLIQKGVNSLKIPISGGKTAITLEVADIQILRSLSPAKQKQFFAAAQRSQSVEEAEALLARLRTNRLAGKTPSRSLGDFAQEAEAIVQKAKAGSRFEIFAAIDKIRISKIAPDYVTKGMHLEFQGIEIKVLPGNNAGVVFKPVFSAQERIAGPALNTVRDAFENSARFRKALYDTAVRAREYLRAMGTPQAAAKAGELTFLMKAIEKIGF